MLYETDKTRSFRLPRQIVRYTIRGIQGVEGIRGVSGVPGDGGKVKNAVYDDEGNEYVFDPKRGEYVFWQPVGGGKAVPKFYKDFLASKAREARQTVSENEARPKSVPAP